MKKRRLRGYCPLPAFVVPILDKDVVVFVALVGEFVVKCTRSAEWGGG
jgi:hypothetical protein